MTEEEIEALARECSDKAYETHKAPPASYTARQAARLAIRETLRRAPKAWPSEAIEAAYREGYRQGANDTPKHLIEDDAWRCSEAARHTCARARVGP